jgi:chromosome segregation ATPase
MASEKSPKPKREYLHTKVGELKTELAQLTNELLAANETVQMHEQTIADKDIIIRRQADRIRELEREFDIERSTLRHYHEELDELYGRNWWQRLFNINAKI